MHQISLIWDFVVGHWEQLAAMLNATICRVQGIALQGRQDQPQRAALDQDLVKDLVESQIRLAAALRHCPILLPFLPLCLHTTLLLQTSVPACLSSPSSAYLHLRLHFRCKLSTLTLSALPHSALPHHACVLNELQLNTCHSAML